MTETQLRSGELTRTFTPSPVVVLETTSIKIDYKVVSSIGTWGLRSARAGRVF